MKKQISWAVLAASLCCCIAIAFAGRAQAETLPMVEVAFSPDGGAESLVLRTIGEARKSIRVLAYSFTAPAVTRALIAAKRRGIDVAVTVDARSNFDHDRSGRARAALGALAYSGIPVRVVNVFPAQHSKFIVVDGGTVETGSYNYSQQARYNAENVIVLRGDTGVADAYQKNWEALSARGQLYRAP
ncbi:phospholipase D family protein [Burkholderia vietnamiensis]|uniref:phospholipase D family nuclease n=1 Tax=Burkholderia vietnamiensis TaxID=60552 RepID=UPI000758546F|nr:phospholipase D family protein [Burkholderia vietnamiensis]KVE73368.1 endonuclease [Burkholderia vietnamiensis]KVF02216.1 endonuclease [Burkholderia vietnamiensis]KVF63382.1 endonuclease [Burkholderia vietnamiensis]HDR9240209.1 phospholipase D family protein [Burkholderia vietnamiensis]